MLEKLTQLPRHKLIELYKYLGVDKFSISMKNQNLIDGITKNEYATEEIVDSFINGNMEVFKTPEFAEIIKKTNILREQVEAEHKEALQKADSTNKLLELKLQSKKEAMETVIVKVSSNNIQDINLGKKAETISFSNEFMSVAKVVPFDIPCEVPKCIAYILKEARMPQYVPTSDPRTGKVGDYRLVPKYNVDVYSVDEFKSLSRRI